MLEMHNIHSTETLRMELARDAASSGGPESLPDLVAALPVDPAILDAWLLANEPMVFVDFPGMVEFARTIR